MSDAAIVAGGVQLNETAMQQLQQHGYDRDLVLESLLAGDCNAATAAYHLMQQALAMQEAADSPGQMAQQPGEVQPDNSLPGKRIDTPVRILSRSQNGPTASIQAYRPSHMGLEVEGVSAGYDKGHRQYSGRVSDDSAQALHQPAALHARSVT